MAVMLVFTAGRVLMGVILVVEDDVFIREFAKLVIEDLGHNTLSASEIGKALLLLRSHQHIDALFTDIRLKTDVLGGYEIARQAIKLRPKLRVLYTTGNSITDNMSALCVKGARFLQKPYTEYKLQTAIEELLPLKL